MTRKNDLVCWVFLSEIQQQIYTSFANTPEITEVSYHGRCSLRNKRPESGPVVHESQMSSGKLIIYIFLIYVIIILIYVIIFLIYVFVFLIYVIIFLIYVIIFFLIYVIIFLIYVIIFLIYVIIFF